MEFSILGPVEASVHGRPLGLGGVRARTLFATLVVHANHVVAADQLIDEVWPELPADKAAASLQVRLSGLRKLLRSAGPDDRLVTRPPGYLLRVAAAELDAGRFEERVLAGNAMLEAAEPAGALAHLDAALGLWRGPALAASTRRPRGPKRAGLRSCGWRRRSHAGRHCWTAAGSPS